MLRSLRKSTSTQIVLEDTCNFCSILETCSANPKKTSLTKFLEMKNKFDLSEKVSPNSDVPRVYI